MARDKVKRAFIWMRNSLRIIDRTTLPGEILGEVRPTIDTFGWDRLSPAPAGEGAGPTAENAQGGLASNSVLLSAAPANVMRYVIFLSGSHDDPVAGGLELSFQLRTAGIDIGIAPSRVTAANPVRMGLERNIVLVPGQQLLLRSVPTPAIGTRLFLRMRFVDLDFGEYIASR